MTDAATLYARLRAACCDIHGLSEAEFEAHVRSIAALVLSVRGQLLPEMRT